MTAEPLWGNILIKNTNIKKETKSGLILPDSAPASDKTIHGTVVAVGEGSIAFDGTVIPMRIKKGATVVVKRYEAELVKIEEQEYYVVDQRQVLLVL